MRRTAPARPRGIALIAVLAQLTLLFMVWSLANRQCVSRINQEDALRQLASRQRSGAITAAAVGLALVEAGAIRDHVPGPAEEQEDDPPGGGDDAPPEGDDPPADGPRQYRCLVNSYLDEDGDGAPDLYTLTFTESPDDGTWILSASPYDPFLDSGIDGPLN